MLDITAKSRTLIIIRKCNKRIFLFLRTSLTRPFLFQCEFWNIEWKIGNYRLDSLKTFKRQFQDRCIFKKACIVFMILYGGYFLYEINIGSESLVHSCLMLFRWFIRDIKQNWISIAYVVIAITSMTDFFFLHNHIFLISYFIIQRNNHMS